MIKYHIMSLLSLAIAALSAIEAAARFYEADIKQGHWYAGSLGWLMAFVCLGAVFLYFRARKFRKQALHNRK